LPLKPFHLLKGPRIGDGAGRVIREQTEPGEFLVVERSPAKDTNNAQQVPKKDKRVTCKTADSLALSPFRPNDPISLRGEVLYQNRPPIGRDLPNFSDIQRESGEVSAQGRPVFFRRVHWGPSACDQTKTTHIIRGIWLLLPGTRDMDGWQKPNATQRYARL
jgi:hypothetical protein